MDDLLQFLLRQLGHDSNAVERLGAAQGLAEVLASFGSESSRLPMILALVLEGAQDRTSAPLREGTLSVLRFLPRTLGSGLLPYLKRMLPIILTGLADDSDGVRDAAMNAGRMIVESFGVQVLAGHF